MGLADFIPIVGPLIGGAMASNASGQATKAAIAMQKNDQQFQALMAKGNMDWNERMASTQYQRAVEDMTAAGLNPALAYQNGGNASPSVSSIGGSNAAQAAASAWSNVGNFASALTNATGQPYSQTQLQMAQAKVADSQTSLNRTIEELNAKYGTQVDADVLVKKSQTALNEALARGENYDNAKRAAIAAAYNEAPEAMRNAYAFGEALRGLVGGLLSGHVGVR